MNPLKILVWAGWYPTQFSNQGIFVKKHLEVIGAKHQLFVFHITHQNHPYKWFKTEKIEERFGTVKVFYVPRLPILKHFSYYSIPLFQKIKIGKIDVFHLHITYPYIYFTSLLKLFGVKKMVLTEHWSGFTDTSGKFDQLSKINKLVFLKFLKNYNGVSVVSSYLKKIFSKKTHFENITITPNILELETFGTTNKKSSLKYRLISISNLVDEVKNISLLIKVIEELVKEIPSLTLDIYGDGKDKNRLMEKAEISGLLNKNIFFKGFIPNHILQKKYEEYDAFILLSNYETFSIVTFEAILNNLPVIVSKCGGVEDYVNENNGVLVDNGNLKSAINGVKNIFDNYNSYRNRDLKSTLNVEKYTKENILKQFEILYQS